MPIRGIRNKSKPTVTSNVTKAKIAEYSGMPRASKSAHITFDTARATVPGKIHQITGTLATKRAPNINGINQPLKAATTDAVRQATAKTCLQTRQVNSLPDL